MDRYIYMYIYVYIYICIYIYTKTDQTQSKRTTILLSNRCLAQNGTCLEQMDVLAEF